jgi:DtxR family Mn-dependent transcriptional regulator
MKIRASAEDYLETILLLSRKNGEVRSKDIVAEMGFSKPSVSVAIKKLKEDGMVEVDKEGYILLTPDGLNAANKVYNRHSTLVKWLLKNGVSEKAAMEDACKMEHIISDETFDAIVRQLEASEK